VAERAGVDRARIALQQDQRDRAVEVGEQQRRAGPEALQLGAQRVGQRHPGADEILARTRQRAQRLGLVAIGLEHPEAVMIGARERAQHERVEAVGLAARGPEPWPRRSDLVGMQREHAQPRIQQALDQQPIRALDRHALHLQAHQRPTQRRDPRLGVLIGRRQQPLAVRVGDEHVVLVRRPVHPGTVAHPLRLSLGSLASAPTRRHRCGCSLTGPQRGLRPVAAGGTSHRREGLVLRRPSQGASGSGPHPAVVEADTTTPAAPPTGWRPAIIRTKSNA
jgi:hypothetical protein